MSIDELYTMLDNQLFTLNKTLGNTATPQRVIEQTKNILYNHFGDIVNALAEAKKLAQENTVLNQELADADSELDRKDQEIRELSQRTTKKATKNKADAEGAGE